MTSQLSIALQLTGFGYRNHNSPLKRVGKKPESIQILQLMMNHINKESKF